jgi:hypothetical protein
MAGAILARVPIDLEELTEDVVVNTAEHLDLHVESHRDGLRYSIEFPPRAKVESLPGVPVGASYLGTFDREEAVKDESIDFFASGQPLVEGILAFLEEDSMGRAGLLHVAGEPGEEGFGLLAIYRQGAGFEALAIDVNGRERPEWATRLMRRPLKSRRIKRGSWTDQPGWSKLIRALGAHLETRGQPVALAAFRVGAG